MGVVPDTIATERVERRLRGEWFGFGADFFAGFVQTGSDCGGGTGGVGVVRLPRGGIRRSRRFRSDSR